MKKILVCALVVCAMALSAATPDVTGKWTGTFTADGSAAGQALLVLKQTGTTISGSAGPDENLQWPNLKGAIRGDKITMEVTSTTDGTVYKCDLILAGDHIKGEVTATANGQTQKAQLDVTRVKTK